MSFHGVAPYRIALNTVTGSIEYYSMETVAAV